MSLQKAHPPLQLRRRGLGAGREGPTASAGAVVARLKGVHPISCRLRACARGGLRHHHKLVVIDRPRGRDHDALWQVSLRVKGLELLFRGGSDDLARADHGPSQRVLPEDSLAQQVEDPVLRIVLVHRDLLEHHLALGLELAEPGAPDHVAHHVECALEVAVEHPCVQRGRFLVGARVGFRPHLVEQLVDLLRSVALCATEQHVLDQMGDARLMPLLDRRARAYPEAERHRAHARNGLGDDPHAGVQRGCPVCGHEALAVQSRSRR